MGTLTGELETLQALIIKFKSVLPEGSSDGPIARYFSNYSVDADEGAYKTVNTAFERVFQVAGNKPADLSSVMVGGKHGLIMVHTFFEHFSTVPEIPLDLVLLRLQKVNEIVLQGSKTLATSSGMKRKVADGDVITVDSDNSADDGSFKPPKKPRVLSEEGSEVSDHGAATSSKAPAPKKSAKGKGKEPAVTHSRKKRKTGHDSVVLSDSDEADVPTLLKRAGRPPKKAEWAFTHYTPMAASTIKGPIWRWNCNWCPSYRTSLRTKHVKTYKDEGLVFKPNSNFISHLDTCPNIPDLQSFDVYIENQKREKLGMEKIESTRSSVKSTSDQGSVMGSFLDRGKANPATTMTKKGFRERFVKGIIHDDLPYSFGEKLGMKSCFEYVIPRDYRVPNHQMVRRDLDLLHAAMSEKLSVIILANPSKLAISSDLWTSKNSVYAFAGVVGFWINNDWELVENVLELLPLDGDHSGAVTGRLMFQALKKREVEKKLISNTSDNASSNGKVNITLSQCMSAKSDTHIDAVNMQVGCGGHVINIVSQTILYALGLAPNPDIEDLYETTRQYPLAYRPEEDPEVIDESATMLLESKAAAGKIATTAGRADNGDDSDMDDEVMEVLGHDATGDTLDTVATPSGSKARKATMVDKLHEVVVDILRSEVRRKRMRQLTRETCEEQYTFLVLIRSMVIRWNTTLAEINRAVCLRPALDRWIQEMDRGLTGKKLAAARRKAKRLHISSAEWDDLALLSDILEVLQQATLDLSKKGEPTICKILVLYKVIEEHLKARLNDLPTTTCNFKGAILAGLDKLKVHMDKALKSDYPLLSVVLHPAARLAYFENTIRWDPSIPRRAKVILEYLFNIYTEEHREATVPSPVGTSSGSKPSIFGKAMINTPNAQATANQESEILRYLTGIYPSAVDDPLPWYKLHSSEFPILSLIARDVLAIPGVSIAVERLFSSSKHTLSDSRSSMTALASTLTVTGKEWLKAGLGDDLQYLENTAIH